jgi:hypothetical protein
MLLHYLNVLHYFLATFFFSTNNSLNDYFMLIDIFLYFQTPMGTSSMYPVFVIDCSQESKKKVKKLVIVTDIW